MTIDLNALLTRYRNIAFNIGLVLVALIVSRVIYGNQYKNVEDLRRKISVEEQKNVLFAELNSDQKKLTAYKQVYARREASTIVNDITQIARDSDVRILSIRPGEEHKQAGYSELLIDVSVGASDYQSLARFVTNLENSTTLYLFKTFIVRSQIVASDVAKGKQDRLLVQTTISITTVQ
jgi:hypothetical protein